MTHVKQNFASICIPFSSGSEWSPISVAEIRRMIDQLGNPATGAAKKHLDDLQLVHFMSINVIDADHENAPPTLFIEITVDGDVEQAIRKVGEALSHQLLPIVSRVCGFSEKGGLAAFLVSHNRTHSQSYISLPRSAKGLPFFGVPGVSVVEACENREIAKAARALIDLEKGRVEKRPPPELIARIRGKLLDDAKFGPILRSERPAPLFAEAADAPWLDRAQSKTGTLGKFVGTAAGWLLAALAPPFAIGMFLLATLLWPPLAKAWAAGALFKVWALAIAWLVLALIPALLVLGALLGYLYYKLRKAEKANTPQDIDPDPAVMAEMMKRENAKGYAQNHMLSVTRLEPGWIRKLTILLAWKVIAVSQGMRLSRPGTLNNIGTIHSARWVLLPKTRQVVFVSNFNGSWESYLEDFITKAAMGTTGVWGNTSGFPVTKNLFQKGVEDGDRFKRYARRSMQPTSFWYSAYPDRTCELMRKEAIIVSGLMAREGGNEMDASHAEAWLELFNSIPRPSYALEYEDIQGIMFGGLKNLPLGQCLVLRFDDTGDGKGKQAKCFAQVQQWIAENLNNFSYGNVPPGDKAMYIAFSAQGLRKLGLEEELDTVCEARDRNVADPTHFPAAFALGMAHPSRKRLLQDPAALQWDDQSADAVLLLYAGKDNAKFFNTVASDLGSNGISVIETVRLGVKGFDSKSFRKIWGKHGVPMEDGEAELTIEPFGFVDGVSQPKVRGFPGASGASDAIHRVEPGEFILGYRDNRAFYPPTPQVVAERKQGLAGRVLPSPPDSLPQLFPSLGSSSSEVGFRDFGRNGSYLVIRQLAQDVDGFHKATDTLAQKLDPSDLPVTVKSEAALNEWVAAKMMGRWRNGSSLTESPNRPRFGGTTALETDNDFLFRDKDPQGLRCPFGAHVRRAFPRDSLNPDEPMELSVSNRHRLLRRGRPFLGKKDELKGTFFMCFNADLERQFEFVQQTWMTSPVFHGLANEIDVVASHTGVCTELGDDDGTAKRRFSVPRPDGDTVFEGMSSFVTLEAGGYFFMPGRQSLAFLGGTAVVDKGGKKLVYSLA